MMHALVTDRASNRAFQFGQDFELGVLSAVGKQEVSLALGTAFSSGPASLSAIFLAASAHVLTHPEIRSHAAIVEQIRKVATGMALKTGAVRIGDQSGLDG